MEGRDSANSPYSTPRLTLATPPPPNLSAEETPLSPSPNNNTITATAVSNQPQASAFNRVRNESGIPRKAPRLDMERR